MRWRQSRPVRNLTPILALVALSGVLFGDRIIYNPLAISVLALFWLAALVLIFNTGWLGLLVFVVYLIRSLFVFIPIAAVPLPGNPKTLSGRVCSVLGGGTQGIVATSDLTGRPLRLLLSCPDNLEEGETIEATVVLSRPEGALSPGGFNQSAWCKSEAVALLARPAPGGKVTRLKKPFVSLVRQVQEKVEHTLKYYLSPKEAALASAMFLGETKSLSKEQKLDFRQAGLAHLLSVSGLHILSLLQPLKSALKKTTLSYRVRIVIQCIFLIFFASLTGWRVAVSRAVIMTLCSLAGKALLRPIPHRQSLSLAALIIVFVRPSSVLGVGFWLSFTPTIAILEFNEKLVGWLSANWTFIPIQLARTLSVGILAQTATLPWILPLQGQISLLALFVNLVAAPLTGLILTAVALLVLIAPLFALWQPATVVLLFLGRPLNFALILLAKIAAFTARIRILRVYWLELLPWAAALIMLLLLFIYRRYYPGMLKPVVFFCAGLMLALSLFAISLYQQTMQGSWFLDVGQGDAILSIDSQGMSVLVDGGKAGSGFAVLMPALDHLGLNRVDLAIATHAHDDHVGGLIELAAYKRIKALAVPAGWLAHIAGDPAAEDGPLVELVALCRRQAIPVLGLKAHDTITLNRSSQIEVLDPPDTAQILNLALTDGNFWSLQLFCHLAGMKLLLTADCTGESEKRLAESCTWPLADVLKVAHHGSSRTTGSQMLDLVRPDVAVISVGYNNYGHPSADVLERLNDRAIIVRRTDWHGTVQIRKNNGKILVRTALPAGSETDGS